MGRLLPAALLLIAMGAAWFLLPERSGHRGDPSAPWTPAEARAPEADAWVPRELIPPKHSGEPVLVELTGDPAARYGISEPDEADDAYAAVVRGVGRGDLYYEPTLGRAARELAYQHSVIGTLVPGDIVDYLLRSSGAIDRSVTQGYTRTGGEGMEAVAARLKQMVDRDRQPETGRPLRVGIGEAWVPGAQQPRFIAILLSRREIEITPASVRVQAGGRWVLSGTLPKGTSGPSGLALYPDGRMEPINVTHVGRRFSMSVPAGDVEGELHVSLSATGPFGPSPLLQVPLWIGSDAPRSYRAHMPPDESGIVSVDAAERRAFKLLQADRKRFGLARLIRDPDLDAVAAAHSRDMRDNHFFGHYSPDTGAPADRLAAAGYRASTHAENVALGGSLHGAQAGLMKSLGHRRNILEPAFTHVGIGVSGEKVGSRMRWHLTQLFGKPVGRIDAARSEAAMLARLNAERRQQDVPAMSEKAALSRIAAETARTVAAGGTEGAAAHVLAKAKAEGLTKGGAYAWIQATTDPDTVSLPAQGTNPAYRHVGIGIVQLPDHPQGLVGMVLLFTGR